MAKHAMNAAANEAMQEEGVTAGGGTVKHNTRQ